MYKRQLLYCSIVLSEEKNPAFAILTSIFFAPVSYTHLLADNGVAVVVISSEMEEVLALADRIMVIHAGKDVYKRQYIYCTCFFRTGSSMVER